MAINMPLTYQRRERRTDRPRVFRIPVVPAALAKQLAPLLELLAEHERQRTALSEAMADARRHETALPAAQRADQADYAAALRAGKPDPGRPHEQDVAAAQAAAQRKASALRLTLAAIEADIGRLRRSSAPEWAGLVNDAAAPATDAARAALRSFAAAQQELDALARFGAWIAGQPAPGSAHLPALSSTGHAVTAAMALAALARSVEEPGPLVPEGATRVAPLDDDDEADEGDDEA